jgi:hypothetical protein
VILALQPGERGGIGSAQRTMFHAVIKQRGDWSGPQSIRVHTDPGRQQRGRCESMLLVQKTGDDGIEVVGPLLLQVVGRVVHHV